MRNLDETSSGVTIHRAIEQQSGLSVNPRRAACRRTGGALVLLLTAAAPAAAATVTSNDFIAFVNVILASSAGETIDFDLGADSTIHFTDEIQLAHNLNFVGAGGVTFDGGNATHLFNVNSNVSISFSGVTFQNGWSGNTGGAILTLGQLTVSDSTFVGNHATNTGGAIHGNAHVSGSTFVSNTAGNVGGAISGDANGFGMVIENSTFYNNYAGNIGGAIGAGAADTVLRNSTLFGNNSRATVEMDSNGDFTIESSLIAGNSADDINTEGLFSVTNSLIGSPDGNGLLNGVNGNLVGDGVNVAGFPIASLLAPLADNGGLTQTMELLGENNPALDAGSNPAGLASDQRGLPYARTVGAGTDIGAFERQIPEPASIVLAVLGLAGLLVVGWRRTAAA